MPMGRLLKKRYCRYGFLPGATPGTLVADTDADVEIKPGGSGARAFLMKMTVPADTYITKMKIGETVLQKGRVLFSDLQNGPWSGYGHLFNFAGMVVEKFSDDVPFTMTLNSHTGGAASGVLYAVPLEKGES